MEKMLLCGLDWLKFRHVCRRGSSALIRLTTCFCLSLSILYLGSPILLNKKKTRLQLRYKKLNGYTYILGKVIPWRCIIAFILLYKHKDDEYYLKKKHQVKNAKCHIWNMLNYHTERPVHPIITIPTIYFFNFKLCRSPWYWSIFSQIHTTQCLSL